MIHITEYGPDIQQGDDCVFNCAECPLLEDVEFDKSTTQLYVNVKTVKL